MYELSRTDEDLKRILTLQKKNIESQISHEELQSQGFVTVHHDIGLLQKICGLYGHMLARDMENLAAYALVMLKEYGDTIPVLKPMFEEINQLYFKNEPLEKLPYVVMGQVCVDKAYRGTGVFQHLYQALQRELSSTFTYLITEVAIRNQRSIRAHTKVGFECIKTYEADGEVWEILLWDWKK
ncbi:GNAT family N-acetyltransferase [Catalinimonas niigatensis]|uniref:GNAT family N-acetyltransferase n=1 Tax=Catalinimonas niigatensis TaxID=1397264 RepID=UPI002665149B|nr:GNAT family N-acetyltransferase [Catalinimonas niigatensis]WPP51119.1 GNAT family N-acetyltransferase [Catalinimonas niigatensis]